MLKKASANLKDKTLGNGVVLWWC